MEIPGFPTIIAFIVYTVFCGTSLETMQYGIFDLLNFHLSSSQSNFYHFNGHNDCRAI